MLDFARKMGDMTGGDLRIEALPLGAVAPASGLLEAVSKGALDGSHGVLADHYDRQSAFALWGAKALMALGVDVARWPYWTAPAQAVSLKASVVTDVTSVMDIGIILGAILTMAATSGGSACSRAS